jgi:sugar lactone lactonase YvrE
MLTIKVNYHVGLLLTALGFTACSKHSTPPTPTHPAPPALSISSFSPSNGPDSTTVTITGADFNSTAADDSVYFNGKSARVVSATDSTLVAIVPELAGTGNVVVKANGGSATGGVFTYDTTWLNTLLTGQLLSPQYLTIDASGNLYVTTLGNNDFYKITPQGDTSSFATLLRAPEGMAIDASGNLYVVSNLATPSPTIYEFTPSGARSVVTTTDSVEMGGLAVDAIGNLYASNLMYHAIYKITPQGQVSIFAANIQNPSGLAVDKSNNLYATSSTNPLSATAGVILKFSPTGAMTTVASGLMLGSQDGIAIDPNNNLYVTCYSTAYPTSTVVKISPAGTIDTLSTNFHIPLGIALDAARTVYVVESDLFGSIYGNVSKLTMH